MTLRTYKRLHTYSTPKKQADPKPASVLHPNKRVPATDLEWQRMVAIAFDLAGHKCERCSSRKQLDPHHKVSRAHGGKDEVANIEILCRVCHDAEHGTPQWKGGLNAPQT